MKLIGIVILLGLAVLLGPASGWGAILVRDYELNGSFADALGGPAINPDNGTLNPTNYSFGPNQGLNVLNAVTPHDYSPNDSEPRSHAPVCRAIGEQIRTDIA